MKLYPGLCISKVAAASVAPYRIVAPATGVDDVAGQAAAGTDKAYGISGHVAAAATERFDVYVGGIVPVEFGGNVADGDLLTSDAQGRAVVAAAGSRVIGIAQEKGDLGTIGSCLIAPSIFPA